MTYIGHDDAWHIWRSAMASGKMHHAWIFTGRRGIGKAGFAAQAARALVAADGVQQPENHPDILTLSHLAANKEEEKKQDDGKPFKLKRNITVDQIRQMQKRLTTRPTLGNRRVIIIDPADDLEKGASNALLKSLEEPPAGSFFILITHRLGQLLPTIRSRCRLLVFPQIDGPALDTILQDKAPKADAAMRAAAIAAAAGSPGAALDFVQLDLGRMHSLMQRLAAQGDPDFALCGQLADAMGARPERSRQLAAIDLARSVVSSRLDGASRADIPALADAHAELIRLSAEAPTYNYDPGLLVMEIGTLLTALARPRGARHG